MGTEPVISVDITIDSTGAPRQGFGTGLIASHNATWPERTRDYASTVEVGADWATSSPEYRCAAAMFAQENPPDVVKIGRIASPVTQVYTLDLTADGVANAYGYSIGVEGQGFDEDDAQYTSGAAATKGAILGGIGNALNAVTDKNYLATFAALVYADKTFTAGADDIIHIAAHGLDTGDGPFQLTTTLADLPLNLLTATDYWWIKIDADTGYFATSLANAVAGTKVDIGDAGTGVHTLSDTGSTKSPALGITVTGAAPGNWFSIDVPVKDLGKWTIRQTHASGTLDEDLAAILVEDDEWYCLLTLYNSHDYVKEAAAWCEANDRIYVTDILETEAVNTAFDIEAAAVTDTGGEIAALGYKRSLIAFHQRPAAFFAASWMGLWLPTSPGKATAALKTPSGVETTKLNTTQRGRLEARRMSAFIYVGGRGITWESKVPNTTYEYLDVTRNIDYLKDGISSIGFSTIADADIIEFTPSGLARVAGAITGFLIGEATDNGVLNKEVEPKVIPPKFSTVSTTDKKNRRARTFKFNGQLSGAIHAADIDGSVTF